MLSILHQKELPSKDLRQGYFTVHFKISLSQLILFYFSDICSLLVQTCKPPFSKLNIPLNNALIQASDRLLIDFIEEKNRRFSETSKPINHQITKLDGL